MHYRKYLRCVSITALIALSSSYAKGGCFSSKPLEEDPDSKARTPLLQKTEDKKAEVPGAHFSLAIPIERTSYMGDFGRIVRSSTQPELYTVEFYGPSFLGIFFPKNRSVIYLHYICENEARNGVVSAIEFYFDALKRDTSEISEENRFQIAGSALNILQRESRTALQGVEPLSTEFSKSLVTVLKMQGKMSITATNDRQCKAAKINVINFGTIYLASGLQDEVLLKEVQAAGGKLAIIG